MIDAPLPAWQTEEGLDSDVVVATRCRVARNLADRRFPWRADEVARLEVVDTVVGALQAIGGPWSQCAVVRRVDLDASELVALADARYTTREWSAGTGGQAVVIAPDAVLSALLNEEDHVRLQCMLPGLQVREAFRRVSSAAADLAAHVRLAHDDEFGFLTTSPSNAGSGIRLSAWMHVPALASDGKLLPVLDAAVELGSTVRGAHGEGSRGTGELFQLSNTWADARSAERAVERLSAAAAYVVGEERSARAVRFGSDTGQAALRDAASDAFRMLEREDSAPRRLLQIVSVLRLAVAEGVLAGQMAETARWLAAAGGADPEGPAGEMDASARSEQIRWMLGPRSVRQ